MSGRRRGGSGRGVAAALLALGCCLLSAPAANADVDDLFDIVFGAVGGIDVDPGDISLDTPGFDLSTVLQDPLAQLDQLFHDAPAGADAEPAVAGAPAEPGPGDSADSGSDGGATAPGDAAPSQSGAPQHHSNSEDSNNNSSFPKMPGGGGGSGGGGNGGGSGSQAGNNAKAKPNPGAPKHEESFKPDATG